MAAWFMFQVLKNLLSSLLQLCLFFIFRHILLFKVFYFLVHLISSGFPLQVFRFGQQSISATPEITCRSLRTGLRLLLPLLEYSMIYTVCVHVLISMEPPVV